VVGPRILALALAVARRLSIVPRHDRLIANAVNVTRWLLAGTHTTDPGFTPCRNTTPCALGTRNRTANILFTAPLADQLSVSGGIARSGGGGPPRSSLHTSSCFAPPFLTLASASHAIHNVFVHVKSRHHNGPRAGKWPIIHSLYRPRLSPRTCCTPQPQTMSIHVGHNPSRLDLPLLNPSQRCGSPALLP